MKMVWKELRSAVLDAGSFNKENMVIQAWYPLGHGDKALIEESVFSKLAAKYGKSNAQIILR